LKAVIASAIWGFNYNASLEIQYFRNLLWILRPRFFKDILAVSGLYQYFWSYFNYAYIENRFQSKFWHRHLIQRTRLPKRD